MSSEEVVDPLSDDLDRKIREQTGANTQIYREVFGVYPDDTIQKMKDYVPRAPQNVNLLSKIKGFAV